MDDYTKKAARLQAAFFMDDEAGAGYMSMESMRMRLVVGS